MLESLLEVKNAVESVATHITGDNFKVYLKTAIVIVEGALAYALFYVGRQSINHMRASIAAQQETGWSMGKMVEGLMIVDKGGVLPQSWYDNDRRYIEAQKKHEQRLGVK